MYWDVDLNTVKANGGQVSFDGGQLTTDLQGNALGGSYPEGHVSLAFPGQSKGWVERNLLNWLKGPYRVIP